jgi:hypothetical protein
VVCETLRKTNRSRRCEDDAFLEDLNFAVGWKMKQGIWSHAGGRDAVGPNYNPVAATHPHKNGHDQPRKILFVLILG